MRRCTRSGWLANSAMAPGSTVASGACLTTVGGAAADGAAAGASFGAFSSGDFSFGFAGASSPSSWGFFFFRGRNSPSETLDFIPVPVALPALPLASSSSCADFFFFFLTAGVFDGEGFSLSSSLAAFFFLAEECDPLLE